MNKNTIKTHKNTGGVLKLRKANVLQLKML